MEVAGSVAHKARRRTKREIMQQKRQDAEAAGKFGRAIVEMGKR